MLDEVTAWAADRPSVELRGLLTKQEVLRADRRVPAGSSCPSEWEETFGLVVVEAMAVGVPPLASGHGSFPELITDGVDGALFDPGPPDALGKLLLDVDTVPDRYDVLGRNARATYEAKHDPGHAIEQLLDIYRFAIDRSATPLR